MTTSDKRPNPFVTVWAESDNSKTLPIYETASEAEAAHKARASMELGFPPITMKSAMTGGVPPWGQDHNGILKRITQSLQWIQAGGIATYNSEFSQKNNGYAYGSILQGDDPDRPWVLWMSTTDNNTNNPNDNKIDSKLPINGWVRYPVISGAKGSSLYYDQEGRLEIASSSVNLERWVSSSKGSDTDGEGTQKSPYYSIKKALDDTPGSGAVKIYLKDTDTHYWSVDGTNWDDYQDQTYDNSNIDISSRKLTLLPYDDAGTYDRIRKEFEARISDGSKSYCLSDEALKENKIFRPKLILLWEDHYTINEQGNQTLTGKRFCTLQGVPGDFSVKFYGIEFQINRYLDLMGFNELSVLTGWALNGGDYMFVGCVFNYLPPWGAGEKYNNFANIYMLGGGGDYPTSYTFSYQNKFVDDNQIRKVKFISEFTNLTIIAARDEDEWIAPGENTTYKIMSSNAREFLEWANVYCGKIDIIQAPEGKTLTENIKSYRYANIRPNFEINRYEF